MRLTHRVRFVLSILAAICLFPQISPAKRIDAKKGRQYRITKRHGPWMIMVASFHTPPIDRRGKGMSPQQAADQLVYELRRKGIPAYAYSRKDESEFRNSRRRSSASEYGGVTVLAGNYSGPQNKLAQATLQYLKKFRPQFLSDVQATNNTLFRTKSGGLFRSTPGRPGPLSGAHLAPNPLLSAAEISNRRRDPLLLKLNSGTELSLLRNPGKYTLVVASFQGKSSIAINSRGSRQKFAAFKTSDSLDKAGRNAWELATALRRYWKVDAWVYHDRHRSYVTVGSFNSPKDRRIAQTAYRFRPKVKTNPRTGRKALLAESLDIPMKLRPGQKTQRKWIFDPTPRLMIVPKFGK